MSDQQLLGHGYLQSAVGVAHQASRIRELTRVKDILAEIKRKWSCAGRTSGQPETGGPPK